MIHKLGEFPKLMAMFVALDKRDLGIEFPIGHKEVNELHRELFFEAEHEIGQITDLTLQDVLGPNLPNEKIYTFLMGVGNLSGPERLVWDLLGDARGRDMRSLQTLLLDYDGGRLF